MLEGGWVMGELVTMQWPRVSRTPPYGDPPVIWVTPPGPVSTPPIDNVATPICSQLLVLLAKANHLPGGSRTHRRRRCGGSETPARAAVRGDIRKSEQLELAKLKTIVGQQAGLKAKLGSSE